MGIEVMLFLIILLILLIIAALVGCIYLIWKKSNSAFKNIGSKLRLCAKVTFVVAFVTALLCIILGLLLIDALEFFSLYIIIGGLFLGMETVFVAMFIYGFAQIVDDVHSIRSKGAGSAVGGQVVSSGDGGTVVNANANADEFNHLPKL